MIGKARVTSFEIAQLVGVSQPTVSRALRGDKSVSEETRQRVVDVARQLNYKIDMNASRLRTQRTHTLALVIICRPGEDRANINPFYLSLLGCIAASASNCGYSLIVSFQDAEGDLYGDFEESRRADGIIILSSGQNETAWSYFAEVRARGNAVIGWASPEPVIPNVSSNNRMGGRLATDHLIGRGRTRIAFAGPIGTRQPQFEDRYLGYCDAVEAAGLEPIISRITARHTRERQGYDAVQSLISKGVSFDGLFAANDFIALGAMQCLRENGKSIPGDVALIGFDGIRAGDFSDPSLSTIEQDYEAAGVQIVSNLLALIEGGQVSKDEVPVRLRARGSS